MNKTTVPIAVIILSCLTVLIYFMAQPSDLDKAHFNNKKVKSPLKVENTGTKHEKLTQPPTNTSGLGHPR